MKYIISLLILFTGLSQVWGQTPASFPYSHGFETSNFGNEWEGITSILAGKIIFVAPLGAIVPPEGDSVLVMHTNPTDTVSQNQSRLHIDLSGQTQVELSFLWAEFGENETEPDGIYLSDDSGTNFSAIQAEFFSNTGHPGTDNNVWRRVVLDIDELASDLALSLNANFVIKFEHQGSRKLTLSTVNTGGIGFDDISVHVPATCTPTYHDLSSGDFIEDFESGLGANWCVERNSLFDADTTSSYSPRTGSRHLVMGSALRKNTATNETNLYLDLSGQTEVRLDGYLKKFLATTNDAVDGIYFSDNGGSTFTKVHDITAGSLTANTWTSFALDVDNLASANGLSLTSTFVIQFRTQETADPGFDGGYAFDDVEVKVGVLPIELVYFNAVPGNEGVQINWQTSTEINNDFFTIERSRDGINYNAVAIVEGAGNTAELVNYEYLDEHPLEGVSYYRLKQTDFDGRFEYSDIVSVNNAVLSTTYQIYPNPLRRGGDLKVQLSQHGMIEQVALKIFDSNMRLLYNQQWANIASRQWTGSITNIAWPPGIYYVQTTASDGKQYARFVVTD